MEGANLMQSPIVKELITCEVCAKFLINPRVLPCQHSFCLLCLENIHALRQADSHIRLGSLRCPTCRAIAAIPLGGLDCFPVDQKVEKVRQLVDELLIQSILQKSVSDSRSSLNSGDELYGSRASVYGSSQSISGAPKVTNQTQTDVSWEDLSQATRGREREGSERGGGSVASPPSSVSESSSFGLKSGSPNRRRRRRPRPQTEDAGAMENELFISEEPCVSPKAKVNGMSKASASASECRVDNGDVTMASAESMDKIITDGDGGENAQGEEMSQSETSQNQNQNGGGGGQDGEQQNWDEHQHEDPDQPQDPREDDPIKETVVYEIAEHVWEARGFEYAMPTSAAFLGDGTAVVAEYGQSTLQFFSPDGRLAKSVDDEMKPYVVCAHGEDKVLVGDRRDRTLKVYDAAGEEVLRWEADAFKWISGVGVTASGDRYVVCEREKCKIGVYEPDGNLVKEFGSHGNNDTQFSMADFLAVDSHDRIILCDSANHCVKIFNLDGKFLGKFGERGSRNGQLEWPKSVCLDHRGNILVSDKQNNRVCMFSPDGEFIQHMILGYPAPYAVAFHEGDPHHFAVTHYDLKGNSKVSVFALNDKSEAATED